MLGERKEFEREEYDYLDLVVSLKYSQVRTNYLSRGETDGFGTLTIVTISINLCYSWRR